MITKINSLKDIPNTIGYSFYAVLKDGTICNAEVYKDKHLHRVREKTTSLNEIKDFYKQMIGWLPIDINDKQKHSKYYGK